MGEDNASGALKFAIGLVITMIFIGIVIVAFTFGRSHANSAISSMSKDTSQLEENRYTQYDGVFVTGVEVINIINKFEQDDIYVAVTTTSTTRATALAYGNTDIGNTFYIKDGSTNTANRLDAATEATRVREAKNPASTTYITPSAEFYAIVNRSTETNAIIGISFFRING